MRTPDTTMMPQDMSAMDAEAKAHDEPGFTPYFSVEKDYKPSDLKLSAVFRQWRADSHCKYLHGYALGIKLGFGCFEKDLDKNGWVLDFGGLKPIKEYLCDMFDHKVLVAEDDPSIKEFRYLAEQGLIEMIVVPRTGCEGFSKLVYEHVHEWLATTTCSRSVDLLYATVYEHGANSATYSH